MTDFQEVVFRPVGVFIIPANAPPNMAFLSIWMDSLGRSSETNCLQIHQLDVCGGQLKLTGGIASCLHGGPNSYQMDSFAVDQKLLISSLISS